jgi:hypothetical protein
MQQLSKVKTVVRNWSRLAAMAGKDFRLLRSVTFRHPLASPWDVGEPWWNAPAIRYLQKNLPARARAFEWGSGGSTVWLASRGAEVVAIESEPDWHRRVSERVPEAEVRLIPGADSGTLRSELQLRDQGKHFFDDYVAAIDLFPDASFDVVIIDGIARCECAKRAGRKVKPNGFVVLDDTNAEHLFAPAFAFFPGWEVTRLRGFKRPVTDHNVWETTFFRRPH